jgi:hypothetical protein
VYPSSEHAWAALKTLNPTSAFEVGGTFAKWSVLKAWPCPKAVASMKRLVQSECGDTLPQKLKSLVTVNVEERHRRAWTPHCIGIIAKMACHLPTQLLAHKYGVRLDPTKRIDKSLWHTILRAKFGGHPELAKRLLATSEKVLVEFDRHSTAKKPSHYGAVWCPDKKRLVGDNAMGKLLMRCRAALLARK